MDSTLLLQSVYHYQESLIKQQHQCKIYKYQKAEYIVDDLFLLRNRILASTYLMGGPAERILPSLELSGEPLIFQIPVTHEFLPDIDYRLYFENTHPSHHALSAHLDSLNDSSFSRHNLSELQTYFQSCLVESKTVPVELCKKILSKASQILAATSYEKQVSRKVSEYFKTVVCQTYA
jgi:hypothetical protein